MSLFFIVGGKMQIVGKKRVGGELLSGLLGGTLSLTVSSLVVKLLGLIYKIPLASILGDEGMGYFNSAYTVYAFFYLLCTAGVPKAVMILVSEAKAAGRADIERKIVRIASILFLSLGAILTAIFIIFSAPLAVVIGNSRSAYTMLAIAPSIIFISLAGVIRGYLSANMLLLDVAVSQVIEGAGKLAIGLLFAMVGKGMNMPLEIISAMTILGVTLGAGLGLLYLFICSKIKIKNEKTGQKENKQANREIIKRILFISVPITVSAAIMSMTNIIDLGLIMRSLTEVGYAESEASALYGNYTTLAVPMFNLAVSIITPVSVAYLPLLTRCAASGDTEGLIRAERSSLDFTAILSAPMTVGMVVFAKEILGLLFPGSEVRLGASLLVLIAPAIPFSSLLLVTNTALEAQGRVNAPLVSMIFGSIAKVIVSLVLITKTDLGILGAPIGTFATYTISLLISLIIYGKRFKRSLPIIKTYLPPYLVAIAAIMLARAVYDWLYFVIDGRALILISIALAALIYLGLLTFFGILSWKKIGELAKYTKT